MTYRLVVFCTLVVPLFFASACATFIDSKRNMRAPGRQSAEELVGQNFEAVTQKLGAPADQDSPQRAFWFLQEEPDGHPNPQPKLYEFRFSKGELISIERAQEGLNEH